MRNKRKNEKIKRIVAMVCAALVAFAFLVSIISPAVMAVSQRDVDAAKKKTEETKSELEKAKREKEEILAQFELLEKQISDTQNEVSEIQTEIDETEIEILKKEEELTQAEKEYNEYQELFKVRARAMYENTEVDYLEIFFGAEDFGDLLSKIEIVSQIMKYDQEILIKLDATKKKIEATKIELEEKRDKLKKEAEVLDKKMEELQVVSEEKQKMLEEISKDVEKYRIIYEAAEAAEAAAIREYQRALRADANPTKYTGGAFKWPVPSSTRITSKYGNRIHPVYGTKKFHSGIDIGAPQGAQVLAAADGIVTLAATNGGYGQCIIINHGSGLATLYGHNSKLFVKQGDSVKKGDLIAYVGSTGVSTGPHLHFEVRENGSTRDPMGFFG